MEKRAIIAALLMAGLLIAYQTFFMQSPETPLAPKAEAPGPKPGASPVPAPVAVAVPSPVPVAAVPLRTARVDGPAAARRGILVVPRVIGPGPGSGARRNHARGRRRLRAPHHRDPSLPRGRLRRGACAAHREPGPCRAGCGDRHRVGRTPHVAEGRHGEVPRPTPDARRAGQDRKS